MKTLKQKLILLAAASCLSAAALPAFAADSAAENQPQATASASVPASQAPQAKKQKAAAASYSLVFDASRYKRQTLQVDGKSVTFRAYQNIPYVRHPAEVHSQSLSIYIPEAYFTKNGTINGYTAKTAPIFLPNGVGGYMPGSIQAQAPTEHDRMNGGANASLIALSKGYVVTVPAIRGRTTTDKNGTYVGKAPALIVDYKAAVRYLRYNKDRLPAGDTEKIISNGTSAGGALSALLGATGNSKDYEPYLKALGAADERDDIYASSVYCPITNLEHADMAYEWIFSNVTSAYQQSGAMQPQPANNTTQNGTVSNRPLNAPTESARAVPMSDEQIQAAQALKAQFPAYVNSLNLHDKQGNALTLNADGTGPFADYIKSIYMASAQSALDSGDDLNGVTWAKVQYGRVTAMDLDRYAAWATRLKATPAFDKFDLSSGENDEFGDSKNNPEHFTTFSYLKGSKKGGIADSQRIRLLNPLNYIGQKGVSTAGYWRIRHGVKDRDTSLALPAILALKLENNGDFVDFASPWGYGHAGDYDLDQLFTWIDSICKK